MIKFSIKTSIWFGITWLVGLAFSGKLDRQQEIGNSQKNEFNVSLSMTG